MTGTVQCWLIKLIQIFKCHLCGCFDTSDIYRTSVLFHKKEDPLVLHLVVFLSSGMAPQATVFLEGMQGASSGMCVPVDIF